MKNHVKITTLQHILDLFYPCYCKGCGKIGDVFCDCCIFYNSRYNPPFLCDFDPDFRLILAVGLKEGVLEKLVKDYKYHGRRHYALVFGKMLRLAMRELGVDRTLRETSEKVIVVPLPTVLKHVRQRGFDHMMAIAREFAGLSGFMVLEVLTRDSNTVQVGSSKLKRKSQARDAYRVDFEVLGKFSKDSLEKMHFLLVDDVWTTGASMRSAEQVLRAGLIKMGVNPRKIKISAMVLMKNSGYEF